MAYDRNRKHVSKPWQGKGQQNKPRKQWTPDPEGLAVAVRDGEDVNKALRRLKKKIERDGLFQEIREREYYTKPSEKRKKAKAAAVARWRRKQRELEQGTPKRQRGH
jgi:small subunit ribosomal protein S21